MTVSSVILDFIAYIICTYIEVVTERFDLNPIAPDLLTMFFLIAWNPCLG